MEIFKSIGLAFPFVSLFKPKYEKLSYSQQIIYEYVVYLTFKYNFILLFIHRQNTAFPLMGSDVIFLMQLTTDQGIKENLLQLVITFQIQIK